MSKRQHEEVEDILPVAGIVEIDNPKLVKLGNGKQSSGGEDGLSNNENIESNDEGSDFYMSVEDESDSDNGSIEMSPADGDKDVSDPEESGTIDKNTWVIVHPPEPAIDMKSKFKVSNTGFCNVPKSKNPMDFFSLFLTDELFLKMVQYTNEYARCILENEPETNIAKLWYDVTLDEMKKFWSILLNMGLSQRSRYKDFWSTHSVLFFPFFARVMTLQRFESILFMIRLASPSRNSSSNLDPLVEVDSLLTSLNSAFKRFCVPDQDLRLDESLIFTSKQNRYTIQYVNKKHFVKDGFQKFEFCDPSSEFIIHIGLRKCSGVKEKTGHSKDVGLIYDLLNEANLAGKGYHLFIRKAYMGLRLSQQLLSVNTFVTGPLDLTQYKDFPATVTRRQLKLETTLYARSGDHLLIKYNNQKPVCLTTGGWAENQSTENAKCQQRVKPLIVRRYLKYISGKDKCYLHGTCTIDIDSYWKKIAFNLVDLAVFNSFILFKSQKHVTSKYTRQTFLENIVQELSSLSHTLMDPSTRLGLLPNLARSPSSVNLSRNPSKTVSLKNSPSVNMSSNPFTKTNLKRSHSSVNRSRNPPTAANLTRNSCTAQNLVNKLDSGGGHKLTRVSVSTVQICKVCRREGKTVQFICPVCNVYVHKKCFKNLKHSFNPQKDVQTPTTELEPVVRNVGSCINVQNSGIFEVTNIKVESDSDG